MSPDQPLTLLGLCGSLRAASSNAVLLRVAAKLAPKNIAVIFYEGLGQLPHFNPDLDLETPPPAVSELRRLVSASDGLLISSPEYAHGVPGALKNALDWLVSDSEFVGKPVALINPSRRAAYARASLIETLTVMNAHVVSEASVVLSLQTNSLTEAAILNDADASMLLGEALARFVEVIQARN